MPKNKYILTPAFIQEKQNELISSFLSSIMSPKETAIPSELVASCEDPESLILKTNLLIGKFGRISSIDAAVAFTPEKIQHIYKLSLQKASVSAFLACCLPLGKKNWAYIKQLNVSIERNEFSQLPHDFTSKIKTLSHSLLNCINIQIEGATEEEKFEFMDILRANLPAKIALQLNNRVYEASPKETTSFTSLSKADIKADKAESSSAFRPAVETISSSNNYELFFEFVAHLNLHFANRLKLMKKENVNDILDNLLNQFIGIFFLVASDEPVAAKKWIEDAIPFIKKHSQLLQSAFQIEQNRPQYTNANLFYKRFINFILFPPANVTEPIQINTLYILLNKNRLEGYLPCSKAYEDFIRFPDDYYAFVTDAKVKLLFSKSVLDKRSLIALVSKKKQFNLDAFLQILTEIANIQDAAEITTVVYALINNTALEPKQYNVLLVLMLSYGVKFSKDEFTRADFSKMLSLIAEYKQDSPSLKEEFLRIISDAEHRHFQEDPLHKEDLSQVKARFQTISDEVKFPLPLDRFLAITARYERLIRLTEEKDYCANEEVTLAQYIKQAALQKDGDKVLTGLCQLMKRMHRLSPFPTQIINIIALAGCDINRQLAQIKTGEGKSLTIAICAAYHALMTSEKVDISTSSDDLAVHDAKKFKSFYEAVGLTSNDITGDKINKLATSTEAFFLPQILYSTLVHFEHCYEFQQIKHCKEKRAKDLLISDEADSFQLDQVGNPAIISGGPISNNASNLYRAILERATDKSQPKLSPEILKEHLQKELGETYTLERCSKWIEAVDFASRVTFGVQFHINEKNEIEIIDNTHTGGLKKGSRWTGGRHQILEEMWGLEVKPETKTGAYMNPIQYIRLYKSIIGVTGTLGTEKERQLMKLLYDVQNYDSPRARPPRQHFENDIHHILKDRSMQTEKIAQDAIAKAREGRPVLIITSSVNESQNLLTAINKNWRETNLYNGIQDTYADEVLAIAGNPGVITIATNIAGRGSDIIPTPAAEESGGLHVIVTFPCENERVEQQAFGRTRRQGRNGSRSYMLNAEELGYHSKGTMGNFFREFETDEARHQRILSCWHEKRARRNELTLNEIVNNAELANAIFSFQEIYWTLCRIAPPSSANTSWFFMHDFTSRTTENDHLANMFEKHLTDIIEEQDVKKLNITSESIAEFRRKMLEHVSDVLEQFIIHRPQLTSLYRNISQNLLCFAVDNNLFYTAKILLELNPSLLNVPDSRGKRPENYVTDKTNATIKSYLSQHAQPGSVEKVRQTSRIESSQ